MDPRLAIAVAYALGCVSFATLAARAHGVDIRTVGSGNPGATNVRRALGPGWGRAVLLADALKGALPVWLLSGPALEGDPRGRSLLLAAAVIGHVFPLTARFRGGKGVATLIGGFLALDWLLALIAVSVHLATRRVTGFVSLASVALAWSFPLAQWVIAAAWPDAPRFLGGRWVLAGLALVVTARHAGNFARIRAGTEDRYDDPPEPDPGETD